MHKTRFQLLWFLYWHVVIVRPAVFAGRTRPCMLCTDPIIPGDRVGLHPAQEGKPFMFHAGIHFALNSRNADCAPEFECVGTWDGYAVRNADGKIVSYPRLS